MPECRRRGSLLFAGAFPPAENLLKRRAVVASGVTFGRTHPAALPDMPAVGFKWRIWGEPERILAELESNSDVQRIKLAYYDAFLAKHDRAGDKKS